MAYRQGPFEKLAADVYDVMHEHVSDYISDISFLKQKFNILISSKDKIYNPNFQKICYNLLRFFGNEINITQRNKKHCEDIPEICNYIHTIFTEK